MPLKFIQSASLITGKFLYFSPVYSIQRFCTFMMAIPNSFKSYFMVPSYGSPQQWKVATRLVRYNIMLLLPVCHNYSCINSFSSNLALCKLSVLQYILRQWCTQEFFRGGDATNSVEDRGQRE
jgi:hypothetical protein